MGSIIAQGECRGQACLPMTEPQQELLGQRPSSLPPTKQKPPAKWTEPQKLDGLKLG